MPRIYASNSDPLDFCRFCMPNIYYCQQYQTMGEGPDGRGDCYEYAADHPPYSETDYCCERCGDLLQDADD